MRGPLSLQQVLMLHTVSNWVAAEVHSKGASLHCTLLFNQSPPEEPLGTPLPNTLKKPPELKTVARRAWRAVRW